MRIRGTVKWFNDTKGYGFLRRDDGQSDCFVHHSDIQGEGYRSLQEGEKVEFDVIQQPKGPKASNVVKVTDMDSPAAAPAAEPAYSEPTEAPAASFGSAFGADTDSGAYSDSDSDTYGDTYGDGDGDSYGDGDGDGDSYGDGDSDSYGDGDSEE